MLRRGDSKITLMLGAELTADAEEMTLALPLGRKPPSALDVLVRAEMAAANMFLLPEAAPPPVPQDVLALCDRAASEGLVKAADARRTLHLLDDSPLIEWMRPCGGPACALYPGVGILSESMVTTIRGE